MAVTRLQMRSKLKLKPRKPTYLKKTKTMMISTHQKKRMMRMRMKKKKRRMKWPRPARDPR